MKNARNSTLLYLPWARVEDHHTFFTQLGKHGIFFHI